LFYVTKRILVIEDDLLNRMFLCATLEGHGFRVRSLDDGRHALATAQQFKPDLIVTDIQLPHVSGLLVISTLRKDRECGEVPVLAVTAYVGRGEEARIRRAGANDYLPKPVSIRSLMAAVDRLLAGDPQMQPALHTRS
jgi:two-component system cell cycle response regulator DivK